MLTGKNTGNVSEQKLISKKTLATKNNDLLALLTDTDFLYNYISLYYSFPLEKKLDRLRGFGVLGFWTKSIRIFCLI